MRSIPLAILLGMVTALLTTAFLPWIPALRVLALIAIGASALLASSSTRAPAMAFALSAATVAEYFTGARMGPHAATLLAAFALVSPLQRALGPSHTALTIMATAALLVLVEVIIAPFLTSGFHVASWSALLIATAINGIASTITGLASTRRRPL